MGLVDSWAKRMDKDTQRKLLRALKVNYCTQEPDVFHVRPHKIFTMLL